MLGRHVGERSDRRARLGDAGGPGALQNGRDTEIEHFHSAVVGEHQVLRLDVAVDEPAFVRDGQNGADLRRDRRGLGVRQRAPFGDQLVDRAALHQVHDQVEALLVDAGVVNGRDPGMPEPRRHRHLAGEPPDQLGGVAAVGDDLVRDQLDRDPAAGGALDGLPDLAHAAPTERHGQLVATPEYNVRHPAPNPSTQGTSWPGR
nr:hypothetical protein [Actinomadura sp. J1-007]